MPGDLMTTREVAAYLGVHEKQVYVLIRRGAIPATRATGKYLFPRRLVDEWIEATARRAGPAAAPRAGAAAGLRAAGSDDVAIQMLQALLLDEAADCCLFAAPTGSRAGLAALATGRADLAFCHLLDPESGEYTVPFVRREMPGVPAAVVALLHRDVGLVVAPGNPKRLRAWADLGRRGVRLVNRQPGSGTRLLLDARLAAAGVRAARVAGYGREVRTHLEVGAAVLRGEADVGLAEASVARLLRLGFVPLARERFDLVVPQALYFTRPVQRLLEVVTGRAFRDRVRGAGGYDTEQTGRVVAAA